MTTIVLSDTHLTEQFDRRKFELLRRIIASADRVILNGDLWDGYLTTFDRFVTSDWSQLFPLLLERKAVYLYGNHDPKRWADDRVSQFSVEQHNVFKLTLPNLHFSSVNGEVSELVIQHGHRIVPHADANWPQLSSIPFVAWLGAASEKMLVHLFGQHYLRLYAGDNEHAKVWATEHLRPNQLLVTGHNHLAEFDIDHRTICTGFIRYGHATYLTIVDGQPKLIRTRY